MKEIKEGHPPAEKENSKAGKKTFLLRLAEKAEAAKTKRMNPGPAYAWPMGAWFSVFFVIPLAIILPKFFGVMGIYYAEPISDITAATVAFTIFFCVRKKIVSEEALSRLG